jgi:hypothetical protein
MTARRTFLATILVLVLSACASDPRVGSSARELSAEGARGDTISLAALEGKVVILDFWAVW